MHSKLSCIIKGSSTSTAEDVSYSSGTLLRVATSKVTALLRAEHTAKAASALPGAAVPRLIHTDPSREVQLFARVLCSVTSLSFSGKALSPL